MNGSHNKDFTERISRNICEQNYHFGDSLRRVLRCFDISV